eukprot:13702832-Ditylum_brightwellii.AAC.1
MVHNKKVITHNAITTPVILVHDDMIPREHPGENEEKISLFNACVYNVLSISNLVERFEANVIEEYVFAQANGKGHHFGVPGE